MLLVKRLPHHVPAALHQDSDGKLGRGILEQIVDDGFYEIAH